MSVRVCETCGCEFDKSEFVVGYVYGRPLVDQECELCRAKRDRIDAINECRKKREKVRELKAKRERAAARHRASEARKQFMNETREMNRRAAAGDK